MKKNRAKFLISLTLLFSLSCSRYSYDANDLPRIQVDLMAQYAVDGALNSSNNLMEFGLVNTGGSISACVAGSDCTHFGEKRKIILPNEDNCESLNIQIYEKDRIPNNFFDWSCSKNAEGGVLFKSQGFALGKGISDLIDWKNGGDRFKEFSVEITSSKAVYYTQNSLWWSTNIYPLAASLRSSGITIPSSKTIYTLGVNVSENFSGSTTFFNFQTNSASALVLKPGISFSGSCTGSCYGIYTQNVKNIWVEGEFNFGTGVDYGASLNSSDFTHLRNSKISGTSSMVGLDVYFSRSFNFSNINVSNVQSGIKIYSSSHFGKITKLKISNVDLIGLYINGINELSSNDMIIEDTGYYGAQIESVQYSVFNNFTISKNSGSYGALVLLGRSDYNEFRNLTLNAKGSLENLKFEDTGNYFPRSNKFYQTYFYHTTSAGLTDSPIFNRGYATATNYPSSSSTVNIFEGGNWQALTLNDNLINTPTVGACSGYELEFENTISSSFSIACFK